MRFIGGNEAIQDLPEFRQHRLVIVTLRLGYLQHIHAPFGDVLVQLLFLELDMEGTDLRENLSRVSIPLPAFELPCRALEKMELNPRFKSPPEQKPPPLDPILHRSTLSGCR